MRFLSSLISPFGRFDKVHKLYCLSFLGTIAVLLSGAEGLHAQSKKLPEGDSGSVTKYNKKFNGIGPTVYVVYPEKSKKEKLQDSYTLKLGFQDSITKALDFQQLVEGFKATSNEASIQPLLSTVPINKADWLRLVEHEANLENYPLAYALLQAYAVQALRSQDIKEAVHLLNEALLHAQKTKETGDLATIQYNLANIYFYLKDVENAGFFQEASYKMAVQHKNGVEQAVSLVKIALIQAFDKDYISAESTIIRKAIPLLNKAKAYDQKVDAWVALAKIYQWQNKHTEAQWFLIQARDLAVKRNVTNDLAVIEYMLAFSKQVQKNYTVAEQEFIRADKLAQLEQNKLLQLAIADRLGQVYMERNDIPNAENTLRSYQTLRRELFKTDGDF
ncbi:tetratricopeptide repeat protein [Sphingobacterium sp. MYb382]|uniref:tetratricopeptide repeat protein n=1 Tax=Sphingobacterium sp. MYb382 TaxID=2745278 RepID=UPI0030B43DD6